MVFGHCPRLWWLLRPSEACQHDADAGEGYTLALEMYTRPVLSGVSIVTILVSP